MMTAKRKLLLYYLIFLALTAVCILLRNILAVPVFVLLALLLKRILHPFPKHRFKFANYGLPGEICGIVLWAGTIVLAVLCIYYFNVENPYRSVLLVLIAVYIPIGIMQTYGEIKLAMKEDKNYDSHRTGV